MSEFKTNLSFDDKEINKMIKKKNLLKELEGNTEMLNMLSIDRLRQLIKYYDSVIDDNNKKIKKM